MQQNSAKSTPIQFGTSSTLYVAMSQNVNTVKLDDLLTQTITIDDSADLSLGAVGSNGPYIYSNGTNTIDWSNISITSGSGYNWASAKPSGKLSLLGEEADIEVNGRSLMSAIAALEERLNVLVPNPELEAEWDELRELGERYRELEKKCIEKGQMWKKLKSLPPETK